MSNEHVGYSHQEWERPEHEYDEQEQLLWRNYEVRLAAKDLRLNVEALPKDFPNRDRVLHIVKEVLTLMPALDAESEAKDERRRQVLEGNLKRNLHE